MKNIPVFPDEESREMGSPFLNEVNWEKEIPFLTDFRLGEVNSPFLEAEAFEDHPGHTHYGAGEYWDAMEQESPGDEGWAFTPGDNNGSSTLENEAPFDYLEWEEDYYEKEAEGAEADPEQDFFLENFRYDTWFSISEKGKKYFPNEPAHNADQFPIPPWITASKVFQQFREKYGSEANTIIGNETQKVSARYFVIHDTAVAADFTLNRVKDKGIHLWLNARKPVVQARDWHVKGLGVKLERKRNHCFLHIEVTRDPDLFRAVEQKAKKFKNGHVPASEFEAAGGLKQFGTYYTDKQYELLAYAYIVASLRKGSFLTVTIHREVDRSVVRNIGNGKWGYGHNDPQFFDLKYFYALICSILSLPSHLTFGIQYDRHLEDFQGNKAGRQNAFIPFVVGDTWAANQYGNIERLNPAQTPYKTVKLKHGYYYDVTNIRNNFPCNNSDFQPDTASSPHVSSGYGTQTPAPVKSTSIDIPYAVNRNRYWGGKLGWDKYVYQINDLLAPLVGMENVSLGEEIFAEAAAIWQRQNGFSGKDADGVIGPNTWGKMAKALNIPINEFFDEFEETRYGDAGEEDVSAELNPEEEAYGFYDENETSDESVEESENWTITEYEHYYESYENEANDLALPVVSTLMPKSGNYFLYGPESKRYGIPEMIAALQWIGERWHSSYPAVIFRIGDISKKGGGKISPHSSHRIGLDVDVNLQVNGSNVLVGTENPAKGKVRSILVSDNYIRNQRSFVREFIKIVLSNPILPIHLIFYRDPEMIKEFSQVKDWVGHHNHLHLRFYMPKHRVPQLDLNKVYTKNESKASYKVIETREVSQHAFSSGSSTPGTSSGWSYAVTQNRYWRQKLGWDDYVYQINDLLLPLVGMENVSLGEEIFAEAVAIWQSRNGFSGKDVDGIIGPNTWKKLKAHLNLSSDGTTASTPYPGSSTQSAPLSLGKLTVNNNVPELANAISQYQFTADDALWLARFVEGEAGGRDDADNHAVIWAVFNRYAAFRHLVPSWGSFGSFIRKYSTALQPILNNVGAARRVWRNHASNPEKYPVVEGDGYYEGTDVRKVQYKKHINLQKKPWEKFTPTVKSLVTRILNGQIPNPGIGIASEFGSTRIYFKDKYDRFPNEAEWLQFTRNYKTDKWTWVGDVRGINQMKNAFFIDNRLKNVPDGSITVQA